MKDATDLPPPLRIPLNDAAVRLTQYNPLFFQEKKMSNNKKKPAVQQEKKVEQTPKKKLDKNRIFLIVFAAIALIGIVVAIVIGLNDENTGAFDYKNTNLSKYVTLDSKYYDGYTVTVDVDEPTEISINNAVIKALATNKIKPKDDNDKEIPGYNVPGVTLGPGDVANIWYRGYYLDENNSKVYFDGGCNFESSIASLEIGSGSFLPGFEYHLIGKNQNDYATMTRVDSGFTEPGDIISLTYSVHYADGNTKLAKTALIDLSDPAINQIWGEGFSEYFNNSTRGKEIGTKFATGSSDKLTVPTVTNAEGDDIYFDMTVNKAYRIDTSVKPKLEVEAYFASNYSEKTLAGKTAHFEVYIVTAQDYEVPEFNEEFVTEKLKLSIDDINAFEGDTLLDKYKNHLSAELQKTYEDSIKTAVENKFWEDALKNANFKKLPETEVQGYYDDYIEEIENLFANGYSTYYSSVDEFARAYLGLSTTADWKANLYTKAEDSVKQKILFYYIIGENKDMFTPNDAEYQEIYDRIFGEHLQSYLDYYKYTEETEGYAEKVETGKKVVLADYGEAYFEELVTYEFFMDMIVEHANITCK